MEDMVDALKMAFAVFVFVMALTLAFTVFSQAKETSEFVFRMTDRTNFEEYVEESKEQARIVGMETILPLVARYTNRNEMYRVEIRNQNGEIIKYQNGEQFKSMVFDLREDDYNSRTPKQISIDLKRSIEELIKRYQNRKFYETYSQEIYKGQISEEENGEIFEENTQTWVTITYQLIS